MAKEQFLAIIVPLCNTAKSHRCIDYHFALQKARLGGKYSPEEIELISLFEKVFSYYRLTDSPAQVFSPLWNFDGKRTAIPDDLTPEERAFLAALLPSIENHEIRARVADTLWELKFGKATDYAVIAIKAYLDTAATNGDGSWRYVADSYARALQIYFSMRRADKSGEVGILVNDEIVKAARQSVETGHPYLTMRLIDLTLKSGVADSNDFINEAKAIAERFEKESNFHAAHDAWLLVARLQYDVKKDSDVTQSAMRAAETYVKLADAAQASDKPSYMTICSWLESAAIAYRHIKGGKERANELYLRLTSLQPRIRGEMQHFSFNIDIKKQVLAAIDHVSGRSPLGAIMAVAFYRFPTPLEDLKKYAEDKAVAAPLTDIIAGTYHNKQGHVVARKTLDEPEINKLHRAASEIRKLQPAAFIVPALARVRFEHNISLQDWVDFLHTHPWVPDAHRITYARGLYYGYQGDYITASHVLMPQVEASLRHMLKEDGIETSKLNREGLQEEKTLSELLEIEHLEKILGKDNVFDLKSLLDEKVGDNFRHLLLHGLQDDVDLEGPLPVYFYWLILHLIFLPLDRTGLDLRKLKPELEVDV